MIEAASNNHIWAEKLDGKFDDIFTLQDSLTMSIVSSVATRVEKTEFDRVRRKPTTQLDAGLAELVSWLKGRAAVDRVGEARAALAARGLTL